MTKICTKCKRVLPIIEFWPNGPYLRSRCATCESKIRTIRREQLGRKSDHQNNYLKNYGITFEEFESLRESQNNLCAICHKPEPMKDRILAADHDKIRNKFRGVICSKCNIGLGFFNHNIQRLKEAITYLEKYESQFQTLGA